jgi:hypothetical protein
VHGDRHVSDREHLSLFVLDEADCMVQQVRHVDCQVVLCIWVCLLLFLGRLWPVVLFGGALSECTRMCLIWSVSASLC